MRWLVMLTAVSLAFAALWWADASKAPTEAVGPIEPAVRPSLPTAEPPVVEPAPVTAYVPVPLEVPPPATAAPATENAWVTLRVLDATRVPMRDVLLTGAPVDGGTEQFVRGVTAPDGTLLARMAAGTWKVEASTPDFKLTRTIGVAPDADQAFDIVRSTLAQLRVLVVDPQGRLLPVDAGLTETDDGDVFARVDTDEWISLKTRISAGTREVKVVAHPRGPMSVRVLTPDGVVAKRCQVLVHTAFGTFSLRKTIPFGRVVVVATGCHRGRLWMAREELEFRPGKQWVDLHLRDFEGIGGRIVDADGAPVAHARVVAILPSARRPRPELSEQERMLQSVRLSAADLEGASDSTGRFLLKGALPELGEEEFPHWRVFVLAPGKREPAHEIWVGPESPPLELVLIPHRR